MMQIYKELIYEDDNFVLFKIKECIRTESSPSYMPVGDVAYSKINEDTIFAEYYTKQVKIKRFNPKYSRGFKFFVYNISPIAMQPNTIMYYIPLRVCEYKCEIVSVNILGTEISYNINVTCGESKIGKCNMKESTIDNIVKQYNHTN